MTGVAAVCRDVARTYGHGPAATVAIHGITCEVRVGDLIAITGPSGSGKSTLMHLLAGIDTPTGGTICWPAIGERHSLRPGPVAMVFQGPSLLAPLDVVENVSLPLLLAGANPHSASREAQTMLHRLDLHNLAAKLPEELSGGQAQRVAVARALVGHPVMILADEPTGQLDSASAAEVIRALLEGAALNGAALVVSSHDRAVTSRLAITWELVDGELRGNSASIDSSAEKF